MPVAVRCLVLIHEHERLFLIPLVFHPIQSKVGDDISGVTTCLMTSSCLPSPSASDAWVGCSMVPVRSELPSNRNPGETCEYRDATYPPLQWCSQPYEEVWGKSVAFRRICFRSPENHLYENIYPSVSPLASVRRSSWSRSIAQRAYHPELENRYSG